MLPRCYGRTDGRTRKDRATQLLNRETLSFATIECKSGKNLKQNTKVNFMQAWQLWFISWTKFRIRKLIGESLWGVSKENVEVKAQNIHRIIYIVYYTTEGSI